MELNLRKQTVMVNEVLYDGTTEQPLECDVLLPDYCPDIQKILRCEVVPSLLSRSVAGDRLAVDGVAVAHLYYLDENNCLRHAEYKIPYTKTIELRGEPSCPSIQISQSIDYFNCRAVSARRVDMRGAVSISLKVCAQTEQEIVCGAQGGGLQLCSERIENTVQLPETVRQLSIREDLELGYGKPAIGGVVRCCAAAEVTDYKAISGKLVAKAELNLRILYQCEDDPVHLEMMEYTLPVSQVVDLDGVDEDCICSLRYELCSLDVTAKHNADGESRIFGVEAVLGACACAWRKVTLEGCCDCYSTICECKQTIRQVPLLRLLDVVSEACMYKETLDLPAGTKTIIDLWCTPSGITTRPEPDCVTVSGKLNICMFAYDHDGQTVYIEQTHSFSQKIAVREAYETLLFSPQVRAQNATFTMSSQEKLEVRCSLRITGSLCSQYRKTVICDIVLDESHPKERQENMLYLYYASEQEQVWEIAKRYNTSVEAIQQGNQLEDAVLDSSKMLLIPMK